MRTYSKQRTQVAERVAHISTLRVSADAEMFGRTYGSPKPSLPVEPMRAVPYSFRVTMSFHTGALVRFDGPKYGVGVCSRACGRTFVPS